MTTEPQLRAIDEGWELILPLDPVPASRPRVGRWSTYYKGSYGIWKPLAERLLKSAVWPVMQTGDPVHIMLEVVKRKARTSKLVVPNGDLDNYVKAVLDAVTKAEKAWKDDVQVQTLHTHKRFALGGEAPRVHVRCTLSPGALWLNEPFEAGADVYDLPAFMRVPLDLGEE